MPATERVRPHRRDQILAAATDLFRARGFHAVGIDDIGTAAGITGPGVYRHFPSKLALLVAIFDRVTDDLERRAQRIEADHNDDKALLRALVAYHVDVAISERALISVYLQEERSLPAADRRRIRKRQRLYLEHWIQALRRVDPSLDDATAISVVHAAIHVVSSVASYEPSLDRDRLRQLLIALAERVLLGGVTPS